MIKKSLQVLADAVIIIGAHEGRYWDVLCNSCQIAIPATILEEEIFYFQSQDGKHGLSPSHWVTEGKVQRLEAAIDDYKNLSHKLSNLFIRSLDRGELEALALLGSKKYKDYLFTTADRAGIKALGVLGWAERGISLEALLERSGGSVPILKKLPKHYTKKWFNTCLQEGFIEKDLWGGKN